jgi:hypothetical protein
VSVGLAAVFGNDTSPGKKNIFRSFVRTLYVMLADQKDLLLNASPETNFSFRQIVLITLGGFLKETDN